MPIWAQVYNSGNGYYREQRGSRRGGYCVGKSGSMSCHVPDEQMGRIVATIILPEAWIERALAQVHPEDEVERVKQERIQAKQRLRRRDRACVDRMYHDDDYRREKRFPEDKLAGLVVPGVDAAQEARKLLENPPNIWAEANLSERPRT
jgi:hypothetical protein